MVQVFFFLCGLALVANAFPVENSLADEEVVRIYPASPEVPFDGPLTEGLASDIRAKRDTKIDIQHNRNLGKNHQVNLRVHITKQSGQPTQVKGSVTYKTPKRTATLSVDTQKSQSQKSSKPKSERPSNQTRSPSKSSGRSRSKSKSQTE